MKIKTTKKEALVLPDIRTDKLPILYKECALHLLGNMRGYGLHACFHVAYHIFVLVVRVGFDPCLTYAGRGLGRPGTLSLTGTLPDLDPYRSSELDSDHHPKLETTEFFAKINLR
jgi:hypothetical protein